MERLTLAQDARREFQILRRSAGIGRHGFSKVVKAGGRPFWARRARHRPAGTASSSFRAGLPISVSYDHGDRRRGRRRSSSTSPAPGDFRALCSKLTASVIYRCYDPAQNTTLKIEGRTSMIKDDIGRVFGARPSGSDPLLPRRSHEADEIDDQGRGAEFTRDGSTFGVWNPKARRRRRRHVRGRRCEGGRGHYRAAVCSSATSWSRRSATWPSP